MLIYFSSKKNKHYFDFLEEQNIDVTVQMGNFYFSKFVNNQMRGLAYAKYIAVDMAAIRDTADDFMLAIKKITTFYSVRLIILATHLEPKDPLLLKLLDAKIYNIIIQRNENDIKKAILKSISPLGYDYDDIYNLINPVQSVTYGDFTFENNNTKILVLGTIPRCGVTHTSFMIVSFLSKCGANVSYTEINKHDHLEALAHYHDFECVETNHYRYKNVNFYKQGLFSEDDHFTIFDGGVINDSVLSVLDRFDEIIIISGSKPYELNALSTLEHIKYHHYLLFNFAPIHGRVAFERYETEYSSVDFLKYSPSYFLETENKPLFMKLFNQYLREEQKNEDKEV